jgi:hypothetical protein
MLRLDEGGEHGRLHQAGRLTAGPRVPNHKRVDQMANGKRQISNGCPFAICRLPFEFSISFWRRQTTRVKNG